jgi:hypothetical protein
MVRRTITLPESLDAEVREAAADGESFSAAVSRLLAAGLLAQRDRPSWIGSFDSGDPTLAHRVEEVLAELAREADPND